MRMVNIADGTGQALHRATTIIRGRIVDRGLRASGTAEFLTDSTVSTSGDAVLGLGYGPDYWPQVGSGSPPGTKVNIHDLERWALQKPVANNSRAALRIAFGTRRNIMRFGSFQFRTHQPNVYLQVLDEMEQAGEFDQADGAEADVVQVVDDTLMKLNAQRG